MRNTIYLKDLKKSDGFPSDIDRSEKVVVCITSDTDRYFNAIFYKDKLGLFTSWTLSCNLSTIYAPGIYVIEK